MKTALMRSQPFVQPQGLFNQSGRSVKAFLHFHAAEAVGEAARPWKFILVTAADI